MSILSEIGSIATDSLLDWLLPKEIKSGIGCIVLIFLIIVLTWLLWPSTTKGLSVDIEIKNVGIESVMVNDIESQIARRINRQLPQHVFYAIGIKNGDKIKLELTDRDVECTFDSWWYNNMKITVTSDANIFSYNR